MIGIQFDFNIQPKIRFRVDFPLPFWTCCGFQGFGHGLNIVLATWQLWFWSILPNVKDHKITHLIVIRSPLQRSASRGCAPCCRLSVWTWAALATFVLARPADQSWEWTPPKNSHNNVDQVVGTSWFHVRSSMLKFHPKATSSGSNASTFFWVSSSNFGGGSGVAASFFPFFFLKMEVGTCKERLWSYHW